jgi:hypothetical protein
MPMTAASSSLKKDSINKEFIEEVFANCDTAGTGFISIKKLKVCIDGARVVESSSMFRLLCGLLVWSRDRKKFVDQAQSIYSLKNYSGK